MTSIGHDEKLLIFTKNLQALEIRYPHITWKQILSPFQNTTPEGIQIAISRTEDPTLLCYQHAVHSLYNPKAEAQKMVQNFSHHEKDKESYIIIGLGLGYLASELLECNDKKPIIIIEPDLHLLSLALSLRDLYKTLICPLVYLCHTLHGNDVVELCSKLHIHTGHILTNRTLAKRLPDIYKDLQKTIAFYFMCKNVNRKTLEEQGELWVRNLSYNMECFIEIPGIYHLEKIFSGIPALLIAAGPSLDILWPHLLELYDRCVFICVDTALFTLLQHGIEPDFVVSIDSQYWNSRHFDYCHTSKSILVADPSLYPSILRRKKDFSFFLTSSLFPLGKYIEEHLEIKGELLSGGSVATSAFDLCRKMNVHSIWTIGLDLGYPCSTTHVHGSQFEHRAIINQSRLIPAENVFTKQIYASSLSLYHAGNYGQKIRTDRRMEVYRLWFEKQAKTYSCFNLSLGVKIENMPSAQCNDLYLFSKNRVKINNICQKLRQIKTNKTILNKKYQALHHKLSQELQEIITLTQQAQQEIHNLLQLVKHQKNIQDSLDKLTHIDSSLLKNLSKEFVSFLIQFFLHDLHLDQKINTDSLNNLETNKIMYQKLSESADFYTKLLRLQRR